MSLPLDQIVHDERTWPREEMDWDRVEEFAAIYREGLGTLPVIHVVPAGSDKYLIADGVHRVHALEQIGGELAPAEIHHPPPGRTPLDWAYELALGACATAAKTLTRKEVHRAVRRLLVERPRASDREIARLVGCSHQTVGRIRAAGPVDQGDEVAPRSSRAPSPEQAARQLLRAFQKLRNARGTGIADALRGGDRTGRRFAGALVDVYGEHAPKRAREFIDWLSEALALLEQQEETK